MNLKTGLIFLQLFFSIALFAATKKYSNPIIPGFNPDPSICSVGNDFYLVTSTFEYFPGVPVYHSKDLVNWTIIGHVLNRSSQLNLVGAGCSRGIFAPTIRYHNGTYYVITTLVDGFGNFVVTAKNPAGPWSEPHRIANAPGIDPSLFFDSGKVYYCGTYRPEKQLWAKHHNIYIQELDTTTWQLIGTKKEVLHGAEFYGKMQHPINDGIQAAVNNYEGPHIYKKDGYFYLLVSHGGTSENHAVSMWKSDNIYGPYSINPSNPIVTHRKLSYENALTSTGHADLAQDKNGNWWMVLLARRPKGGANTIMGRETCLAPVQWDGEWPVVGDANKKGIVELEYNIPDLKQVKSKKHTFEDQFSSEILNPEWLFLRTPQTKWWSTSDRKGYLTLKLRAASISDIDNPSFVGFRQQHHRFETIVKMDFKATSDNEEAGIVIERSNKNFFRFVMSYNLGKQVVKLIRNDNKIINQVITIVDAPYRISFLRVTFIDNKYSFSISSNAKKWQTIAQNQDGSFLGTYESGPFTGTIIGLYASSNGKMSENSASFDWFKYIPQH